MNSIFTLIRILIGLQFAYFGIHKLTVGFKDKAKFFHTIKLRPGYVFAALFGLVELGAGVALLLNSFLVPSLVIVSAIMLVCLVIKYRTPHLLGSKLITYFLILVGALILLLNYFFAFVK